MGKKDNIIVGLDIGTTKICTIVGEAKENGVEIIGIGSFPSKGLRKGVVINIDATVNSIKKAVEEAELMAGCEIYKVFTGIAGGHIKGMTSHGIIAVKEQEVKESDIRRVVDAARAVAIPQEREVVHILPQEFILDDQDGIREPLGMSGVRLEAKVYIVTAAVASAENIIKCCHKAGLNVSDIVLQPIASAESVLTPEEKELGVVLIDIGGGTTDIAVFHQGSIRHIAVIALGGNHLTNDIATGLRTPVNEAEKIKKENGYACVSMVNKDENIEIQTVGGRAARTISKQALAQIIEPRVEEILMLAQREIVKSGFESLLASGVVLTGGTALLKGISDVAEQVFNMPVRIGSPMNIGGLVDAVNSPMYATGVGLIFYGSRNQSKNGFNIRSNGNIFGKVIEKMKSWFQEVI